MCLNTYTHTHTHTQIDNDKIFKSEISVLSFTKEAQRHKWLQTVLSRSKT